MKTAEVAFVCPVYDTRNHFDYAVSLVKSYVELDIDSADFYFVFSNESQRDKLNNRISEELGVSVHSLVLPEDRLHYKSQVTVKKFFGIERLKDKYKYIATIDCECLFLKNADYLSVFDEIWNTQSFMNANATSHGFRIMHHCYKTVGCLYNPKLLRETRFYRYNVWFNEIPVYKTETLDDFWTWLKGFNTEQIFNDWYCFDYYLYVAYLIIKKGFRLRRFSEIESPYGVIEVLSSYPKEKAINILSFLGAHWTRNKEAVNDKICMFCQLDVNNSAKGIQSGSIFVYIITVICTFIPITELYKRIKSFFLKQKIK